MDVVESKRNEGDISPVLMFGCDDCGTFLGNMFFTMDLEKIKAFTPAGNNQLGNTVKKAPFAGFWWDETDFHIYVPHSISDSTSLQGDNIDSGLR